MQIDISQINLSLRFCFFNKCVFYLFIFSVASADAPELSAAAGEA